MDFDVDYLRVFTIIFKLKSLQAATPPAFQSFLKVTGNVWVLDFGDERIFVIEKTLVKALTVRFGHFMDGRGEQIIA